MNNTTFPFKKKQIVQSVLEPDTHSIWLNHKDNKLYQYNDGWEPIGGTNIYRIFLTAHPDLRGRLVLDPKHDKENTLARKAFNEDFNTHTNNVYLITCDDGSYGEITGIVNCYVQELLVSEITLGLRYGSGGIEILKIIIHTDSEIFRDLKISNMDTTFRIDKVSVTAALIV
jgi:hypothetical protein